MCILQNAHETTTHFWVATRELRNAASDIHSISFLFIQDKWCFHLASTAMHKCSPVVPELVSVLKCRWVRRRWRTDEPWKWWHAPVESRADGDHSCCFDSQRVSRSTGCHFRSFAIKSSPRLVIIEIYADMCISMNMILVCHSSAQSSWRLNERVQVSDEELFFFFHKTCHYWQILGSSSSSSSSMIPEL